MDYFIDYRLEAGDLKMYCYERSTKRRYKVSTGVKASKEEWSKDKSRLLSTWGKDYKQKNEWLENSLKKADRLVEAGFNYKQAMKASLSSDVEYDVKLKNNSAYDLLNFFEDFLKHKRFTVNEHKIRNYRVMPNQLRAFLNGQPLKEDMISTSWLRDWKTWLANERGQINSTIGIRVKQLREFLSWCVDHGHAQIAIGNVLWNETKKAHKTVVTLTTEELRQFSEIDYPPLKESQDTFVFACMVGLRISDLRNLNPSNVNNGVLRQINQKTGIEVIVPLSAQALAIWERYSGRIPLPTDQVFNRNLKKLAERCPLLHVEVEQVQYRLNQQIRTTTPKYQLISAHTARRTFVTRALGMGISMPAVMRMSGHRSLKTLKKYLDVSGGEDNETLAQKLKL